MTDCITCGDVALRMRVLALNGAIGRCAADDGSCSDVALDFVEPVEIGDHIMVHAGVAISRVAPAAEAGIQP